MPSNFFGQIVAGIATSTFESNKQRDFSIAALYKQYCEAILNLDGRLICVDTKHYATFRNPKIVVSIKAQKGTIKIYLNKRLGTLIDEMGLARDVSNIGHLAPGDYQLQVDSIDNFEYILGLIKQGL